MKLVVARSQQDTAVVPGVQLSGAVAQRAGPWLLGGPCVPVCCCGLELRWEGAGRGRRLWGPGLLRGGRAGRGAGARDRSSSVRAGLGDEALFAGAQGQLAAADPRALTKLQESWGSAAPPVALSSFRLQGGVRVSRTARARRLQACGFDQVLLKSFSAGLQNI